MRYMPYTGNTACLAAVHRIRDGKNQLVREGVRPLEVGSDPVGGARMRRAGGEQGVVAVADSENPLYSDTEVSTS